MFNLESDMRLKGRITKILANFYYVCDMSNKEWECHARARLLKEGKYLLVGDDVEIELVNLNQGAVVELIQRKNHLEKPQVANIDQVLIVFSSLEPEIDLYNLDRYLSFVSYNLPDIKVLICVNKIDLKNTSLDKAYNDAGFKIFYVSALTGNGIEVLKPELFDKTTVLAGPSGVGKSSLIKYFSPDEDIKIGDLSSIKTGKHITRNVRLIRIRDSKKQSFLVDTPGFTNISFAGLNANKVLNTFKELKELECSFNNCLHNGYAEGCKLNDKDILSKMPESRVQSYLKILDEVFSETIYGTKVETKSKIIGGKEKSKSINIPKISTKDRAISRRKRKQNLQKIEIEEQDETI